MNTTPIASIFPENASMPANIADLKPGFIDLTDFAPIRVTGEDALSFLQGQFTNHIMDMSAGEAQITGYCTPKGRALAVMWLLKTEEGCKLLVPAEMSENLLKRLQMFKMRAKVSLEIESTIRILGVIKSDSSEPAFSDQYETWSIDQTRSFIAVPADLDLSTLESSNDSLFEHAYWQLAQILSAEPMVYQATQEALIPQHMNLDLVNGVSFTKGCYPGQEIVARLRYLGKLKQRMIIGYCETGEEIFPGTPVFTQEKGEQKAGIVVDAVRLGNRYAISVNVPATHISAGNISIGSQDGALLERTPMPYKITLEKDA